MLLASWQQDSVLHHAVRARGITHSDYVSMKYKKKKKKKKKRIRNALDES